MKLTSKIKTCSNPIAAGTCNNKYKIYHKCNTSGLCPQCLLYLEIHLIGDCVMCTARAMAQQKKNENIMLLKNPSLIRKVVK